MNDVLLAKILIKLGTMEGKFWAAMRDEDESLDPDRASYSEVLIDLSDRVGELMLPRLLTAFPARPSHKALRDWAVSLAPAPAFDIRQISAPRSDSPLRLTGPKMDSLGHVAQAVGPSPPSVKQGMTDFRIGAKADPDGGKAEYGLEFVTGRTQPSYTQARAEALAEERNRKWPHQHTGVFRKGDPAPEGVNWSKPDPITPEQYHAAKADRRRVPDLPVPSPKEEVAA